MKYYHFTALHLADLCEQQGLTKGHIVVPSSIAPQVMLDGQGVRLQSGYQWLTTNPSRNQEWCNPEYSNLPYRRDAVRFTISIPEREYHNIIRSNDVPGFTDLGLGAYGDPENWFAFKGTIPPDWIIDRTNLDHEKFSSNDTNEVVISDKELTKGR